MGKSKGVVSEQEWNSGVSASGSPEKASAILKVLEDVGTGGSTMAHIGLKAGIRWPYSTVRALVKAGTLEVKKIGKANYFRIKRKRASA